MTRPIKFRVWDKEGKCWIPLQLCMIDHKGKLFTWDEVEEKYLEETIPYELVFFTGLHDKNGKEIWEGDIIRNTKFFFLGVVASGIELIGGYNDPNYYGFLIRDPKFHANYLFEWNKEKSLEVCGNQYENPELLK